MTPPRQPAPAPADPDTAVQTECSTLHAALDLLGRAWAGPVLWALRAGPTRYRELRDNLPGISDAVLAARLKDLCAAGLAQRQVTPGPPVQVRYRLTPAGADALPALRAVLAYGSRYAGILARRRPPTQ